MATKKVQLGELELILAGSPDELKANIPLLLAIAQIVKYYMNQPSTVINRPPISPEFKDYLMLTCHWKGINKEKFKKHTVEKGIRLKKVDIKTLTVTKIHDLAKRVREKFDNMNFITGHVKCKYANYDQGVNTWGYFDRKETGYHIIESLGDIGGFNIDKGSFKYEMVENPADAFDPTPKKANIANKLLDVKEKAPIVQMQWSHATIYFPYIQHTELLCTQEGYLLNNLNFLNQYDN